MRPVILGEAPSRPLKHHWTRPLSGPTAKWLNEHAGLASTVAEKIDLDEHYEILCSYFRPVNAIATYEEAYPWTAETTRLARSRVRFLIQDWYNDDVLHDDPLVIVALGRHAQTSLPSGARSKPFFEWVVHPMLRYVTIPHPSGLNHMYNDDLNHARASNVLRESLRSSRLNRDRDAIRAMA